jgi:hypothetical protein
MADDNEIPADVRALIEERKRIIRELERGEIRRVEIPLDPRRHPPLERPRRKPKRRKPNQIEFWRGGISL